MKRFFWSERGYIGLAAGDFQTSFMDIISSRALRRIHHRERTMKTHTIFRLGLLSALLIATFDAGAAESARKDINTDPTMSQLPFSEAVQVGETLYISGTIGRDSKTQQAAADPKAEATLAMDSIKKAVEAAGYKMDDLVSVTVYCTDLQLYGLFNDIYKTYFHSHFPARAFIGVKELVRGAHFEVMGTAVKQH
jgi:2-iminobutanoate/2-iminopropanoate deaminase